MYPTFRDETAEALKAAREKIGQPVRKFGNSGGHSFDKSKSGSIAKNFFSSTPSEPQPLSTTDLANALGGGPFTDRYRYGFSDALRAQFPSFPAMWGLSAPKPVLIGGLVAPDRNVAASADRTSVGGASWPPPPESATSTKAADLEALALSLGWDERLASSLKALNGPESQRLSSALKTLAASQVVKALRKASAA